ncbi:DUF6366 family protein [Bacillus sp. B-jedd]|uniref:DUF6366 family protein n=1 Tax=Bacillus sp. B-jedd TaxID=1476857 RepID=UPI00051571FE|nr:DUF6366 family protein [Bacillus sp. B-jedd]CEG26237.1 hypothetical protein BN1002_01079 [Bacillus sp. B-jedd]
MSEEERERLKAEESRRNPAGAFNDASARAYTGSPSSGCIVNIISVLMIIGIVALVRACSS